MFPEPGGMDAKMHYVCFKLCSLWIRIQVYGAYPYQSHLRRICLTFERDGHTKMDISNPAARFRIATFLVIHMRALQVFGWYFTKLRMWHGSRVFDFFFVFCFISSILGANKCTKISNLLGLCNLVWRSSSINVPVICKLGAKLLKGLAHT